MKRTKLVLVFALIAVLVLSLAGCSKEADKFVGTWSCTKDVTDFIMQGITEGTDESFTEYFTIEKFEITLIATFDKEGNFSMKLDETKFSESMQDVLAACKTAMVPFFEAQLSEAAAEQDVTLQQIMDYYGADTVEELIQISTGSTIDELVDSSFSEDDMAEMFAQVNTAGTFTVKDGKLYTTVNGSESAETYEMEGDTFTLLANESAGALIEGLEDMYPLVFTRVK